MDPEMMRHAMSAMNRLSPGQLSAMQQQMAALPANVLEEQMQAFQRLTPEQKRFAAQQAAQIDPAVMMSQASNMARQSSSNSLSQATALKAEGNRLHTGKDFTAAIKKYISAIAQTTGTSAEAQALIKACNLNLASCYLNTGATRDCISVCTAVLDSEPLNCKALFRRGQALYLRGERSKAVADLHEALRHSSEGDCPPIKLKLEEMMAAENTSSAERLSDEGRGQDPNPANTEGPVLEAHQEGLDQEDDIANSSVDATSSQRSPADSFQQFAENPELMETMSKAIEHIDPQLLHSQGGTNRVQQDQIAAAMQNPTMMKMAMKMMESMPPDQISSLASSMQGPSIGPQGLPNQADMARLANNPEMMKSMSEMMKNISPDDLQSLSQQAGMNISREQAAQMQEKLQGMSPKQMELALKVFSFLQWSTRAVKEHKLLCISVLLLVLALIWRLFW